MCFASTTKLFKNINKIYTRNTLKNLNVVREPYTDQDLSNDTTFSQIKYPVPVPLRHSQQLKHGNVIKS